MLPSREGGNIQSWWNVLFPSLLCPCPVNISLHYQILQLNRKLMDAVVDELVRKKSLTKLEFFQLVELHGSLKPMPPSILDIRAAKREKFQEMMMINQKGATIGKHVWATWCGFVVDTELSHPQKNRFAGTIVGSTIAQNGQVSRNSRHYQLTNWNYRFDSSAGFGMSLFPLPFEWTNGNVLSFSDFPSLRPLIPYM